MYNIDFRLINHFDKYYFKEIVVVDYQKILPLSRTEKIAIWVKMYYEIRNYYILAIIAVFFYKMVLRKTVRSINPSLVS